MRTFTRKPKAPQQNTSAKTTISRRARFGQSREMNSILHLQRTIGNQAVQRMLQTDAQELEARLTGRASPRLKHDSSRISIHPPSAGVIQTKLAIIKLGDSYEQEADRLAAQVMCTPKSQLQRACPCGGGCPTCQSERPGREPKSLQTNRVQASDTGQFAAPPIVHEVLRSPGQPLDTTTRNLMGPRFGHDFSEVRVHADPKAAESARAVNALAYTVGRDVVFGTGRYVPGSTEGTRLLAHELTHVVQQAGVGLCLQREPQPKDANPKLTPFVSADLVKEIKRDNETWMLTIDGFTTPDSLRRLIWPRVVPPGVTIDLKVAIIDPTERGWFVLNGVTFDTVRFMEPSFAKLFSDHGLEDEPKESVELQNARAAFRKRHSGHSDIALRNFDLALKKITKRNPELLLAYYKYYAGHKLTDESSRFDHIDFNPDKDLGGTAYGETIIHPDVLTLTSTFPTSDPMSLLAGTLIHEYVHTPQGGGDTGAARAPKEAKAYAIELFFSERMGDQKRTEVISNISWNSSVDIRAGADKIFRKSYHTMRV